ncbi:hypothetical protein GCK72_021700 [Caenorhabditis remanei]|uniref:DUF7154 domain-containing protein n=1 Tax=Caenorhabditis remanei TaxID=31234 RepID=A0A6A5GKK9_CAERE|nr:hypothetical protein GCK72_021700 [Caenorhabditis remanei]KAF1755131.1 hypothetical protein GCK72_021700 [Caenorhabditis remanei]
MSTLRDKLYAERQLNKHAFGNRPSVSRNEVLPTSNEDPTTEMEPIPRQKHFALLNRVVDSQFRKIILIGLVNIIILGVFVAVLFFLIFLNHKDPHASSPTKSSTSSYPTTNTKPTVTTTTSTRNATDCTPTTPATLLFAYSNDIFSGHIQDACDWITEYFTSLKIIYFANIRFDTTTDDPIYFHANKSNFTVSVNTYLPDSSLSFPSQRTESNVLNVIRKFLSHQEYPLCGSILYILMKRLPNTKDVSDLIQQLRELHIFVYTVTDTNSFGGTDQSLMCEITHATNGFCDFQTTDMRNEYYQTAYEISRTYQFVSQSYQVSGQGVINVPSFVRPKQGNQAGTMSLVITFQNHGTDDNLKSVSFSILDDEDKVVKSDHYKSTNGNSFLEHPVLKNDVTYKIVINYEYGEQRKEIIEVRFYSFSQQHHLALFHRVANSQLRKIVLIGLLNVIILSIFACVLLVLVFTEDKPHINDKEGSSTTAAQSKSTDVAQLTSTTVKSFSPSYPDACTPRSKSTFLFAYSNDLPSDLIDKARDWIVNLLPNRRPECYANRRELGQSVKAHMPNSTLKFPSRANGSDVLNLIRSFLTNEECPLCGAVVYIIMKRWPNYEDPSELIQQLRQHHVFVYTNTDTTPSGGLDPNFMCKITHATNGFCGLQSSAKMDDDIFHTVRLISRPFQIVSESYQVSGKGSKRTPKFQIPLQEYADDFISMVIVFQNHILDDNYKYINYTFLNDNQEVVFAHYLKPEQSNTDIEQRRLAVGVTYQVILDYDYGTAQEDLMEIRLSSSNTVDYWLPLPAL